MKQSCEKVKGLSGDVSGQINGFAKCDHNISENRLFRKVPENKLNEVREKM